MAQEVDLISYLPPFLAEYAEIKAALTAENVEFQIAWEAIERVLQNEFPATADEYGISRFERILDILPSIHDTLEDRRFRVLTRMNEEVVSTLPQLKNSLEVLCGAGNYAVEMESSSYRLTVKLGVGATSKFEAVKNLLDKMVPQNMVVELLQLYNTYITLAGHTHEELSVFTHTELIKEVLDVAK